MTSETVVCDYADNNIGFVYVHTFTGITGDEKKLNYLDTEYAERTTIYKVGFNKYDEDNDEFILIGGSNVNLDITKIIDENIKKWRSVQVQRQYMIMLFQSKHGLIYLLEKVFVLIATDPANPSTYIANEWELFEDWYY